MILKPSDVGTQKALSIDCFRCKESKTGLRLKKFHLEVTQPAVFLNGACSLMELTPSYMADGSTLGLGAGGCRMHSSVADPTCSVCWDLKPQWKAIHCEEVSSVNVWPFFICNLSVVGPIRR